MINGDYDVSGEIHAFRLKADGTHEVFLGHSRVSAVAVYLVECGGKIDGGIVALCSPQGCTDYGRGIGACREYGAGNAGFLTDSVQLVEQLFCLRHCSY